ncbi:unnamed protein product [Bursaphelenchus xylophilus]|uniref:(pine wood nematode) hypothetical protein n=1 Tax=Bursaphelenchus xylophilus TaxID=6326 RepID=A0A811K8I6_BURXY|nr:unnamed protein product [Bursaphelenchus xylophilus]CAG9088912.1 unnamed protein product [Bursaphelenchus xylophilus]
MEPSIIVDFTFKIVDLPPSAAGQASGQNVARTVQAEHPPAVAGSPLGAHHFGVPEGEVGLSIASPTSFSPAYSRSPEYSTGNSTLHGVPSIPSYEEYDAYRAMMAEKTPEPVDEEKAKLRAKMEELIEENRQLLRQADDMRKKKEMTELLWTSEMERANKAEADLEAAQKAIFEMKTKEYRAGRKLEEAIRAKDEALIELEREKEETSRLKQRLTDHLKKAEADARPPRTHRSRSPLTRTAPSSSPTPDVEPPAEVVSPPVEDQVSEGHEEPGPQHEAPGPLRRMPKCRRRCCYQPPPPAPQAVPRPPRRSREVEQLGPIIEEVVEERPRRRSRQPPARLVVDMARRSYAAIRSSIMPQELKSGRMMLRGSLDKVEPNKTKAGLDQRGEVDPAPVPPESVRGASGIRKKGAHPLVMVEHSGLPNEPGGPLDCEKGCPPFFTIPRVDVLVDRNAPAPHFIRGASGNLTGARLDQTG